MDIKTLTVKAFDNKEEQEIKNLIKEEGKTRPQFYHDAIMHYTNSKRETVNAD